MLPVDTDVFGDVVFVREKQRNLAAAQIQQLAPSVVSKVGVVALRDQVDHQARSNAHLVWIPRTHQPSAPIDILARLPSVAIPHRLAALRYTPRARRSDRPMKSASTRAHPEIDRPVVSRRSSSAR